MTQDTDWNIDEFNKKIINPDLITPEIGDESGTHRDFEWEKSLKEYELRKNEAQKWLGKASKKRVYKLARKTVGKKITAYKEPISTFPEYNFPEGATPEIYAVGQSHLDLGYRWRYLQSTEKVKITTEKACFHIENIPEFSFTASQPVMLEWTLHKYPKLFKRIQAAAATGRFELAGGSYCEPDTHMISGESWCRQRLYGQLFYQKYFNKMAETEFIQDSFGFTSTLPQFIAKSGGKYFFTKKINWSDTTVFPFLNFWWQSPDGSRILAYSLSGYQRKKLFTNWDKFAPTALLLKPGVLKDVVPYNYESTDMEGFISGETPDIFSEEKIPYYLFLYGMSDGGHGPRGVEVQTHLALHNKGLLKLGTLGDYFARVDREYGDRLPVWQDEMYLEYHRGTLTASPILKRMNRYFEWTLPAAENLAIAGKLLVGAEFPQPAFDELWKFTLLQQFHDVLPGSNVPEMLDDCWAVWGTQKEKLSQIYAYLWSKISQKIPLKIPDSISATISNTGQIYPIILFNPTSFKQNSRIEIPLDRFPEDFSAESWHIRTSDGVSHPITVLPDTNLDHIHYNLPARVSFSIPNMVPNGFTTCFLIDSGKVESTLNGDFQTRESEDYLSIQNDCLKLSFNKQTGGCISLQFKTENEWIESIAQGKKRIRSEYPDLEPGILPQAFYEYSGVYGMWDLFPKSRYYPYPMSCQSINTQQESEDTLAIDIEFELRTPPASKIKNTKKAGILGDNADQSGRRDPDVKPVIDPKDCTDVSRFTLTYRLYAKDPKVYLTIKSDFHAQDTLVKLDIPTATDATRMSTEVAYGIENRSTRPETSRDKARWENVMHTWVNLQTQSDVWGLGIINNGKYALDVRGGYVGISLVRGKKYPKPFFNVLRKSWVGYERKKRKKAGLGAPPVYGSQGEHLWQIVLVPHKGSPESARILEQAHLFNAPIIPFVSTNNADPTDDTVPYDLESSILPSANAPLEVSTVKPPHPDSDAHHWFGSGEKADQILILRVINWSNKSLKSEVHLNQLRVSKVVECDLLERKLDSSSMSNVEVQSNEKITSDWRSFEIKTFALLLN